jgi:hypothetical protein
MKKLVLLIFTLLFEFAADSKFLSHQEAFKVNIIKELIKLNLN